MRSTEEWRERLDFLTLEAAVMFLRCLNNSHYKKFHILCSDGYKRLDASDLCLNFNPSAPVAKIGTVYFWGGPGYKAYKGNYLTFIVDCVMAAQKEQGEKFVEDVVVYTRGVCIGVAPLLSLSQGQIFHLLKTLHKTRRPIESGLANIGLSYTDYDLDDVEEQLLENGLGQCESCGLWLQVERLSGDCDDCSLRKAIA